MRRTESTFAFPNLSGYSRRDAAHSQALKQFEGWFIPTAKGVSFLRLLSRRAGTGSDPAKREKDLLPPALGGADFSSAASK